MRSRWLGPGRRTPVTTAGWVFAGLALALGALVYWLAPGQERFEAWWGLPAPMAIGHPGLAGALAWLRPWGPDACWALFAGVVARDLLWAGFRFAPAAAVLLAACSWELAQGLGLIDGTFTFPDLYVSMAGGILALCLPGSGKPGESI